MFASIQKKSKDPNPPKNGSFHTEDVYLKSEVKGKLVSSLLPQSEGKRKEAVAASFGNGPSENSNWYVAGRFDPLISKVNGED